jgi:hypothetical protein
MSWILDHNMTTETGETLTGNTQTETEHNTATRPEHTKRKEKYYLGECRKQDLTLQLVSSQNEGHNDGPRNSRNG